MPFRSNLTPSLLMALCAVAFAGASVRADEPSELGSREKGDLAIRARGILRKYCSECHGGESGSRGTIRVLDHARLVAAGPNPVPFVLRGNVAGSQIVQFLDDGSMPPGNRPRPSVEEIAALKKWIEVAAPSYPASFDDRYTIKVMLDDLEGQPPESRAHLRYISLAHLVGEDGPLANLGAVENDLKKAIRWCNLELRRYPEKVDDTATLFRFDCRTMNWDARGDLFFRTGKGAPSGLHSLSPYDLILLEYPHGFRLPSEDPQAQRLSRYFALAKPVQPIPFIRADWFAKNLGMRTLLAEDLKSLVRLRTALENQGSPALGREGDALPCGPDTRAFAGLNPVPPALKAEANPVLPLGAWYSGDSHAEPAPFSLKAEAVSGTGVEPIKVRTTVTTQTPFRLRITADRDLYFSLLAVMADGTVKVQSTNRGGFLKGGEATFLQPASGDDFKIPSIITGEAKATEYFVILASATELPTPTIVKSRHASNLSCEGKRLFPISRFFFDPESKKEGFDPARIVRIVVPITVTND